MGEPSAEAELEGGLIRKAFALRVKYRKGEKIKIPLTSLVVHPRNRSGAFPNGAAVQTLGCKILRTGFNQEVANQEGVCIQEIPGPDQTGFQTDGLVALTSDKKYMTYQAYNLNAVAGVPQLRSCFSTAHSGQFGTISHSHLLLVLLSLKNNAVWDLDGMPADYDCLRALQDGKNGPWKWSAIASKDPECEALVRDGLLMEVLSWQIYKDDPDGAALVSAALNKGNELGLQTTEIEALNVLAGAMPSLTNAAIAAQFEYETLLEKVRAPLERLVQDADFYQIVNFVATMGARSGPWLKVYQQFAQRFVNSSERRLRLSAFTIVNQMAESCPRAKLAVLFRAYRKEPTNGWSPSPEQLWAKDGDDTAGYHLESLESLLNYFWATCQAQCGAMPNDQGFQLQIKVAIRGADTLAKQITANRKITKEAMRTALLEGVHTWFEELKAAAGAQGLPAPRAGDRWISFTAIAAKKPQAEAPKKGEGAPLLPKVVAYDHEGKPMDKQDRRTQEDAEKTAAIAVVPSQEWLTTDAAKELDIDAHHQGAISMVLHRMHVSEAARTQLVKVLFNVETKKKWVVADCDIPAGRLRLPPCCPKTGRFHKTSAHPERVAIDVGLRDGAKTTYYIRVA